MEFFNSHQQQVRQTPRQLVLRLAVLVVPRLVVPRLVVHPLPDINRR